MLKGKTALVTGSTSGIGLGIARTMAKEGANIVINGLGNADEIEGIRKGLESDYGIQALYDPADMTRPDQIRGMCGKAVGTFGSIDILVNSAGIQFVSPIDEFPEDKWDAIIAINMSASFHTAKACVSGMKKKGWGRIINIASVHGLVASPFKTAYVTAKHGMIGLTRTIALEVAGDGITCNAICPSYVNTPLMRNQIKDQAKVHNLFEAEVVEEIMLAPQAVKKFTEIEQLGALAVFLCSDAASTITGASLPVDGGWTAR